MNQNTQAQRLIAAMGAAAYAAYSNSLVGNPAPAVAAYYERVRKPQAGDLVFESSSFLTKERVGLAHECVGRLLRVDERDLWHIESLVDGSIVTWENCDWVAFPETRSQYREWQDSAKVP